MKTKLPQRPPHQKLSQKQETQPSLLRAVKLSLSCYPSMRRLPNPMFSSASRRLRSAASIQYPQKLSKQQQRTTKLPKPAHPPEPRKKTPSQGLCTILFPQSLTSSLYLVAPSQASIFFPFLFPTALVFGFQYVIPILSAHTAALSIAVPKIWIKSASRISCTLRASRKHSRLFPARSSMVAINTLFEAWKRGI
jgi:hypothetical protein